MNENDIHTNSMREEVVLIFQIITINAIRAMATRAPIKSFNLCFAHNDCFLILLA